ncbi:PREDICTED: receptor-like protein 12 [Theobroma cacao]|uniref:Receptor-like protein 12 n=1 Tax=Theobroma cacao TaxID=3641 RepID=A0AB32WL49_THECC|nr:PREDICTED: receptor-like protein 12 [Theobroma cacao]XP_017980078.1 PREDICTED: receptor-like protein 12 [Theobroma cacao]
MGKVVSMLYRILCLLLAFLHFQVYCSLSSPSSFLHSAHLCLPEQRAALLELKNTISLDDCSVPSSYPTTNSWNESTDCCSWDGVSCHMVTGHVIGIDLSNSCLNGTLPANSSLFHLQRLQWLDLSSNNLHGSFLENSSLFHRQGLQQLNLAFNDFNGSISSELFNQLVSLTHLNLSHNSFSDLIPYDISLLSKLVSLDLSNNGYHDLRFDSQGFDMLACNLTELRNLILDSVDMSDVALPSFLNLTSSLERLSLGACELHGEFPSEIFRLPYLQHMDLSSNRNLTDYFPKSNLSSGLKLLDLSFCSFRGSIPASIGNLSQIIHLDFSENDFGGQIPDAFGNLNKLTFLSFSCCNFSGQLPTTMFNLTQLTQLDLSHNRLEGPLPNHVSELRLLEEILLSGNLISGGLPSWLFTLPSLKYLGLSHNKLTGSINQIQKPNSLKHIYLSSNDIHGSIPNSFFDLVSLERLDLSSNNLSGVIKSNMLAKLKNLTHLVLSNNSLLSLSASENDVNYSFPQLCNVSFSSCSITQFPSFFRTSNLEILDLSNNKIYGGISKREAEGWESLLELYLSYNFLTTLEQFPGKNLHILDLRSNLLQGPILSNPLICNQSSLVFLDLSRNNLTGTIPNYLGNFSFRLEFMNLEMNNFYGKVPDSFTNGQLRYLFLNDNQLEGLLPRSLANCSSLRILNLRNNKFADAFPHWLASLPWLRVLILRSNRLHGPMPNSIASSNFSALQIIDLSHNELTGPLPTKFFKTLRAMKDRGCKYCMGDSKKASVNVTTKKLEMELAETLTSFTSIDLSNNLFCGQIPKELGELILLQTLNLSNNNLTGPIPPSFGNMVALESLDLSSNKLGGRIPSQMTNLTFLEVLNLSKNYLVGPIPHGNQFGTFENDSYSNNLGLCGFPLSKQCGNDEEPKPTVPMLKEDEGSEIAFIWKVVMMGYGCGVVLGLSMGYIVFTTGRPWWFIRMVERDWQNNVTKWVGRNRGRRN